MNETTLLEEHQEQVKRLEQEVLSEQPDLLKEPVKLESAQEKDAEKAKKRIPKGQAPPSITLSEAVKIAKKIHEFPGGEAPYSASIEFMGNSSNSSVFTKKLATLRNYGLINDDDERDVISLTELGLSIVAPKDEAEEYKSLKRAFLRIEVFAKLHERLKGRPLLQDQFIINNIIEYVPRELAQTWLERFKHSISAAHLIEARGDGKDYVLENAKHIDIDHSQERKKTEDVPPPPPVSLESTKTPIPLGVGRNAYLELPGDWDEKRDLRRLLKMIEIALNPDYDVE